MSLNNVTNLTDLPNEKPIKPQSDLLKQVITTGEELDKISRSSIEFAKPILTHTGNPIFYPSSINIIQASFGAHKSRMAQIICSALLGKSKKDDLLGFEFVGLTDYFVLYIDTERSLRDQYPYAIKMIREKAGYRSDKDDDIDSFGAISLMDVNRKERLKAFKVYLAYLKSKTSKPLFIVLDVATDCIGDFNDNIESMEFIDLLNIEINKYNAVILGVIHENPKSDKARGHIGTEFLNKSSTTLRIVCEEENPNGAIFKVQYLKCRMTQKHPPFYFTYDKETQNLVLLTDFEPNSKNNVGKDVKAPINEVKDSIERIFSEATSQSFKISKSDLHDNLKMQFFSSEGTISSRINEIIKSEIEIFDKDGEPCHLSKTMIEKQAYYFLEKHK